VLGVSRDEPPLLDDEDERFVAQIGAVIAVALDNDRLLRQAPQLAVGAEPRAPGRPPARRSRTP
jgi:GAF domain-containing protein